MIAKGESLPVQVNEVEARFNAVEIRTLNQPLLGAALYQLVHLTFIYHNQEPTNEVVKMIAEDLREYCRRMSIVEIDKAIREGRRNQRDLFGKLSARHFINWIAEYDGRAGDKIAEHHRNAARQQQRILDESPVLEKALESQRKEERHTAKEKADAMREFMDRDRERSEALQRHLAAWDGSVSMEEWANIFYA